jgi:hypothetical protein
MIKYEFTKEKKSMEGRFLKLSKQASKYLFELIIRFIIFLTSPVNEI